MKKEIWFDMDGTIADLYGVKGWLECLKNEDEMPYKNAKPLVNMRELAKALHQAQSKGYKVNVISWLSKGGSQAYGEKVAKAKRQWLNKHLHSVQFDKIDIVKFGEPKHNGRQGILFDDEQQNRQGWGDGAYNVNNIVQVIKGLN